MLKLFRQDQNSRVFFSCKLLRRFHSVFFVGLSNNFVVVVTTVHQRECFIFSTVFFIHKNFVNDHTLISTFIYFEALRFLQFNAF